MFLKRNKTARIRSRILRRDSTDATGWAEGERVGRLSGYVAFDTIERTDLPASVNPLTAEHTAPV